MQFSTYLFLLLWKDEPWIFWINDTPRIPWDPTLRVALQWMFRKKRSFWPRGAHQDARYYIAESYCPREDHIKFRLIVLSHLWWHLPFGNIDISIIWFYLFLPDDIYVRKRADENCMHLKAFAMTDWMISARLQDWIELPRFLLNLSIIITLINLRTNIFVSII